MNEHRFQSFSVKTSKECLLLPLTHQFVMPLRHFSSQAPLKETSTLVPLLGCWVSFTQGLPTGEVSS